MHFKLECSKWDLLYKSFKPRIDEAQNSKNFDDYYVALREYVYSIPDGHVSMSNCSDIDKKYIGGGFGFSVTRLSDGKIIANWVDKKGIAYSQGMRPGAELIDWNNEPTADALSKVSTIFGRTTPATEEGLKYEKSRFLTRAPIGTRITLSFINAENNKPKIITLSAYDDKGQSLLKNYPYPVVSDAIRENLLGVTNPDPMPESMIEKKILDGNIGYIKIWGEVDLDCKQTGIAPSTIKLFKDAVSELKKSNVAGIILDIRNNMGGSDQMVTEILSSFYSVKTFYEYQNYVNPKNDSMEIWIEKGTSGGSGYFNPGQGLYIEPSTPFFSGPVVAITNTKCISSGEGIAMGIKNLPNGETLGFYGTNGSFGMAGDKARMPGNIVIEWPFGQSLDIHKVVQLDSRNGKGGVSPSIKIPMTLNNTLRVAQGHDVELEHAIKFIKEYKPVEVESQVSH